VATSAGEVEVKLTLNQADFAKLLNKSQDQVKDFGKALDSFALKLVGAFSFAAIANFFRESLNAYGENEQAVRKLTAALASQGITSSQTVRHLTDMATALQNTTGVSDEAIISAQALLTTYRMTGATLDKTVRSALDLSAAMGIDLETAVKLLGKAFAGETGGLSRYGILINQHLPATQKFAAVMQQINSRFGGQAAAQADTYNGKLAIMKENFNDLMEAIGKLLVGPAGKFLTSLTTMIQKTSEWITKIGEIKRHFTDFGSILASFVAGTLNTFINSVYNFELRLLDLMAKIPGLRGLAMEMRLEIIDSQIELQKQTNAWEKATAAAEAMARKAKKGLEEVKDAAEDTSIGVVDAAETQTQFTKDKMAEETKLRSEYYTRLKNAEQDYANGFMTTEADMWDFLSSQRDVFFQGFGDAVGKMIMEGKNFSDSMKTLFKNMAEAFISYVAQMIAKWLAFMALKAAFGGATGGMGFAAAFADGGVIAEPSIITGLNSGRQILAGEAGPEAVVPMGKNMTKGELLGGGGGGDGGSVTINITGTFLEADQNTWQRLMREKIIPEIRRSTMSNPTGPFNRRRGVA
jgi:hypothetical protein